MFAQVIQAKTSKPEDFARMQDRWDKELRPGAKGWVGLTSGVANDGTVLLCVRFESEEAAKANSERPEQGEFFAEASKNFDGEPSFINSSDVQVVGNPSDDAGFVQVMIYKVKDRGALEALEDKVMPELMKGRPDLLGALRVWDGNTVVDLNYFTSEAEAREGEKKMASGDMAEMLQEFMAQAEGEPTFIDLPNPILRSA
jgi:hypothetical protein